MALSPTFTKMNSKMYADIVNQLVPVLKLISQQKDHQLIVDRLIKDGYLNVLGFDNSSSQEEEPINTTSTTTTQQCSESSEEYTKITPVTTEQIDEFFGKSTNELTLTILSNFINGLVLYEGTPTSTAFMHRCYLAYAKKHYKTNAKSNVVQNADTFKRLLRDLIPEHEIRKDERSKGWALAIVK